MSKLHPMFDLLRSDAFITVNKLLSLAIGVNESNLFSELLSRHNYFWENEMLTDDGWFFNSISDLYLGTGLSEYQQRLAISNMVKLNLLETKLKGLPATRYFRINQDTQVIKELLVKGRGITRKVRHNHNYEETKELVLKKLKGNKNNTMRGRKLRTIKEENPFEDVASDFMPAPEIDILKTYRDD